MSSSYSLSPDLYVKAGTPNDVRLMHLMKEQDENPVEISSHSTKIKIVVGPSPFTMPRGWEYYLTAPYEGVAMVSTVLHNAGADVEIIDVRYAKNPLDEAFSKAIDKTDILMMTTFEDNFPFVKELIEKVKRERPELLTICGGSLVTSVPHVFMEETLMDIAMISEGELTALELLEAYSAGNFDERVTGINGLWYRDKSGAVQKTGPRGQMINLDFVPRMRLELWPQAKSDKGLQRQVISSYSRGCQMDCSFCYRTTPQVAYKSIERFEREISWLKEQYRVDFIFFSDLTFTADKKYSMAIMEVLKKYDIRWTCMTRCASVDPEILAAMKESGCDIILFGVESLGSGALKEAKKPTTENVSLRAMQMCVEAGVRFGGLTIVGIPGETEETLFNMVKWAEEFNHITRVKYLSLMPGTKFYQDALKNGTIRSEVEHLNWLSIEQALHEDEFINVSDLSEDVLREAYKRIYDSYQPGPVMDFDHYPEHFLYMQPNFSDGRDHCKKYGKDGWRTEFSSAGPYLYEGSHRFTIDKMFSAEVASKGSSLMKSGAKQLEENG